MKEKKWELIAKAHQEYPKGTKLTWGGGVITSSGVFKISDSEDYEGVKVTIVGGEDDGCDVWDNNEWAEIIIEKPKSILDGKVAIQINNTREFNLLMDHYENKGWNASNGNSVKNIRHLNLENGLKNILWKYGQGFHAVNTGIVYYKQISFSDFAKEVGITGYDFVLQGEDGKDLFEGDNYYYASYCDLTSKWVLGVSDEQKISRIKHAVRNIERLKIFSTKESCVNWVNNQNKPKEVILNQIGADVTINKETVHVVLENRRDYHFTTEQLVEMYEAYQSIQ